MTCRCRPATDPRAELAAARVERRIADTLAPYFLTRCLAGHDEGDRLGRVVARGHEARERERRARRRLERGEA